MDSTVLTSNRESSMTTTSIFMIEQHTGAQWEPVAEGDFQTEQAAEEGMKALVEVSGFDADSLRIVEYTGERALAYIRA